MRKPLFSLICLSFLLAATSVSGQTDFTPDPERATVYFVLTSPVGAALNFKYFAGEQYLGKINYGKYLKVTLDPGKYVLWAKAENIDYLEADLAAGQSYLVNAIPTMGMVKSGLRLVAVSPAQGKKADKAMRALVKHEEKPYTKEELDAEGAEWVDLIARSMEKYAQRKEGEIDQLNTPMDFSAFVSRKSRQ